MDLLPVELKQEILKWLIYPHDFISFSMTSKENQQVTKSLWKIAFIARFGALPANDQSLSFDNQPSSNSFSNSQLLELYKQAHRNSILIEARQFHIAWGNDTRYWVYNVEDSETNPHEYAFLRHVWWFDVKCLFHSVLPGTYVPCFRIKQGTFHHSRSGNNIRMVFSHRRANSNDYWEAIYTIPFTSLQSQVENVNEWTVLKLPALKLDHGHISDLQFQMIDCESSTKQGLSIDYLSLVTEPSFRRLEPSSEDMLKVDDPPHSTTAPAAKGLMASLISFFSN